jgi:hypothetical protein
MNMTGEKLSPILEEIEYSLWSFESEHTKPPKFRPSALRSSLKIFMAVFVDRLTSRLTQEGVNQYKAGKAVECFVGEIKALVKNFLGVDTSELYKETNDREEEESAV